MEEGKKTRYSKSDKTVLMDALDSLIRLIWELSRSCHILMSTLTTHFQKLPACYGPK